MPWGVAAAGVGAIGSLFGGGQAASAAKQAANVQEKMYETTRSDLLPYNTAGQSVLPTLTGIAGSGVNAGGPNYIGQAGGMLPGQVLTEQGLEQTPGYQFVLGQGLKSTQAAAAARGVGVSGASLKGAATYATGLADSTYSNRFNEAQQNFSDVLGLNQAYQGNVTNQFQRNLNIAQLGESAGAQTGQQGTQAAANQGNYINQGGLANAATASGIGNAITGGVNTYLGQQNLQNYFTPSGTGGYNAGYQAGQFAQQPPGTYGPFQ